MPLFFKRPATIIGLFAIIAASLIALTFAGSQNGSVWLDPASGANVATIADSTANQNSYIQFSDEADGNVIVPNWPIKNIDFDETPFSQYDDTSSAQLPQDPFLGPVINQGVKNDLNGVNPRSKGDKGAFRVRCKISHFAYDDPVVLPGEVGASHLHAFFGNTRTNATSTDDSILNSGASTCDGYNLNRSAYWVPTLHDVNGDVVIPRKEGLFVYYKTFADTTSGGPQNKDLELFPEGFKIVSGNVAAALDKNDYDIDWWCGSVAANINESIHTQKLKDCPKGGQMWMRVQFPYCWNGENTYDVNDPHVVPPIGSFFSGKCPETHQKSIPAITYQLGFDTSAGAGSTSDWFLSSDVRANGQNAANGSTIHGDWYSGWNPTINERILNTCLRVNNECSVGVVGNNTTLLWPKWQYTIPAATGAKISRETVRRELCPGDTDAINTDVAMCMSVMQNSTAAQALMNESLSRSIDAFDAASGVDVDEVISIIEP